MTSIILQCFHLPVVKQPAVWMAAVCSPLTVWWLFPHTSTWLWLFPTYKNSECFRFCATLQHAALINHRNVNVQCHDWSMIATRAESSPDATPLTVLVVTRWRSMLCSSSALFLWGWINASKPVQQIKVVPFFKLTAPQQLTATLHSLSAMHVAAVCSHGINMPTHHNTLDILTHFYHIKIYAGIIMNDMIWNTPTQEVLSALRMHETKKAGAHFSTALLVQ